MFESIAIVAILVLSALFYFIFKRNGIYVSNRPLPLLLKIVILLFGLVVLYININNFNDYMNKKSWQMIKAKIISTDVVGQRTKEPQIYYKYQIGDSVYTNVSNLESAFFGSTSYQDQTARRILRNYKSGDSVSVYYNPDNPSESALKIHPVWSTYIRFTFGIFITSIVLALIITVKRDFKTGKK